MRLYKNASVLSPPIKIYILAHSNYQHFVFNNKNKSTALVQRLFKKFNLCIYLIDVIIGVLAHKQYFISTCWCAANVSSFTCCCYVYYGASCSIVCAAK